jgi:hypothetical protein
MTTIYDTPWSMENNGPFLIPSHSPLNLTQQKLDPQIFDIPGDFFPQIYEIRVMPKN